MAHLRHKQTQSSSGDDLQLQRKFMFPIMGNKCATKGDEAKGR